MLKIRHRMRCSFAAISILAAGSSAVFGDEICDPPERPVNQLELSKPLFLSGDYESFFWTVHAARDDLEGVERQAALLTDTYPNGFNGCKTIGQVWYSDSLVSEMVVFYQSDGEAIFLNWVAFRLDENWTIARFGLNSVFSVAYEEFR